MTEKPEPVSDDLDLAELRGRLRGRWKAERRDHEREARRERWLQRDLIDVVTESMHRGDEVAFHLPGPRTLRGHVTTVGRDCAVLSERDPAHRDVTIRVPPAGLAATDPYAGPVLIFEVLARASYTTRHDSNRTNPTFQAVLHQFDFNQQATPHRLVELGTQLHPGGLLCTIQAHAGDHLYVRQQDAHDMYVAVLSVQFIAWAPDAAAEARS